MTESAIVMPKLGLSMSEGLIAEWNVKPGDEVTAGQILFVVETDKISNEIEAPADGRIIQVLVGEGETVDVGTPVLLWTGPGQAAEPAPEPETIAAAPASTPQPAEPRNGERLRSTPFARRLAKQGGVDIVSCTGTGPRGRIQARDVRAALESKPVAPKGRDLRALIAARVTRSKAEIPHFHVTADAVFDALIALRAGLNADPGVPGKLSVTAFIAQAVARALALQPEANVVWREGRAVPLPGIAIAVAVDTPAGVMAPVVPFGEGDIYTAAAGLEAAIGRARNGKLNASDAGEAAIGISNVGMFNVRALTPIIDPDQTYMLGVGAPQSVFHPGPDGSPRAVREVTLTLACDHRAIDGAGAVRFLALIVELLEQPARLLIPRS
jgi:pyruvate dehydrogenase E2 component (dihydrolipoamide acetyltransferase)